MYSPSEWPATKAARSLSRQAPSASSAANRGDRDRHERGLRVPGEREFALLTLEHEARKALAEGLVDLLKHRAGGRKRIVKVAAHADRLGALTGKDDGRRHAIDFRAPAIRSRGPLLTMRPGTCQASRGGCRSRVYWAGIMERVAIETTSTAGVNVGQRTTLSSNTCPRVVRTPPWTYRSSMTESLTAT